MQRMLFLWLCLIAAANAGAAIYQWTDSTGTVQFSDKPPRTSFEVIERQDIETRSKSPPAAPAQHLSRPPAKTKATTARKSKPRTTSHEASARDKRQQRCDKYRERIATTASKLRAGYSARSGITLTERLRADRDAFYHECR